MTEDDIKLVRGNGVAKSGFDTFKIRSDGSKKKTTRVSIEDAEKYRKLERAKNKLTYGDDDLKEVWE